MGLGFSSEKVKTKHAATANTAAAMAGVSRGGSTFRLIPDQFRSYDELSAAMKKIGFENCEVVLAIDFTGSNREQGARTFAGKDLHHPHESLTKNINNNNNNAASQAPPPYSATATAPAPAAGKAVALGAPGGPAGGGMEGSSDVKGSMAYELLDDPKDWNPYQQVMSAMSMALETLNPARRIHVLGFGDTLTEDYGVFCLKRRAEGELKASLVQDIAKDCNPCYGVHEVMEVYRRALPHIVKSGPTSFVPIIETVMKRVQQTRKYCFVFIIGDGAVTDKNANANAIVAASKLPISFSMIGVGDGEWTAAKEFDDELPERCFDNWQTVVYETTMKECNHNPLRFATHALQEAPEQLKAMRTLKYIS